MYLLCVRLSFIYSEVPLEVVDQISAFLGHKSVKPVVPRHLHRLVTCFYIFKNDYKSLNEMNIAAKE